MRISSCFVIPFSIVSFTLGEEGAGLRASRALFVCLFCTCQFVILLFLLLSAVCDCGTPCIFVFTYYIISDHVYC